MPAAMQALRQASKAVLGSNIGEACTANCGVE
jgi:hypothetical protein